MITTSAHNVPHRMHSYRVSLHRGHRAAVAVRVASSTGIDLRQQYDALSSLISTSPEPLLKSDYTALGRGLVALQDMPAGTTCLSIDTFNLLCVTDEPLRTGVAFGSAALSDWQLLHGNLPPLLASYLTSSRGDWFKRLVAWLLWLSRHGSGIWPLYVQLLPKESDMASLMNFEPHERHELQCPEIEQLAEKERSAIQGLYDSVFSSRTGELAALDLAPDFTHTLWAACMVNSRCFSDNVGREELSLMVPCADMANHAMNPNAGYRLDPDTQTFCITTTQDVPAGSEVLISYLGSNPTKSNMQLMKDYGFVLPGNINDTIQFSNAGGLQPLLNAASLLDAASHCPVPTSSSSEAEPAHRRRQQAVMKSLKPFVALTGASGWQQEPRSPAAAAPEKQVALNLLDQCKEQLQRHATTLQEDEQLLAAGQLSSRVQAAVAARMERKRLLMAAEAMLQQYANKLE